MQENPNSVGGVGLEMLDTLPPCILRESSTAIVCPSRGQVDYRVVQSWERLVKPHNQARSFIICGGAEVADAYNQLIEAVLDDFTTSRFAYLMTVEDDNVLPPNAHIRLLEAIQSGPWDGVSALYFRKEPPHVPLALGRPRTLTPFGTFDFKVRDVRSAVKEGEVVEVNAIPMGCAIFKMSLFRQMPRPWFETIADCPEIDGVVHRGKRVSHDVNFCQNAILKGKRFAVDCGLQVGHLDTETGTIY